MCSALLWWLATDLAQGCGWIYLVLFGCACVCTGPALQSLLPQLVPRVQLAHALATNSIVMWASSIGGSILLGLLRSAMGMGFTLHANSWSNGAA